MRHSLPVHRRVLAACAATALIVPSSASAVEGSRYHDGVSGTAGVIATESPAAARAGRDVLARGANAIDAAATTVFALGVARPQSCGIGGGGFMVYRSPGGKVRTLDFRETAGAAMKPDSLVGPGLHKTFTGHLTVGVPGTLAGMSSALQRYGTLSLPVALQPAERLARIGFHVPTSMSGAMARRQKDLALFPAAAAQYLKDGAPYAPGDTLRQPELAATLRRLMREGPGALYGGTLAHRIVRDMRAPRPDTKDPGLLTVKDFSSYKAVWRAPVHTTYRGRDVYAMGPASSGGQTMIEMLNILEGFDLHALGETSAQTVTAVSEAQKIAWADRGAYLGDPAFVRIPLSQMLSKDYAAQRRAEIDLNRAATFAPGVFPAAATAAAAPRAAGEDFNPAGSTTHVSVIDAKGGAVAVTCTIEQEFGSAVVAPGTGFLLNNELTDFSGPGTANEPAPGKRPRSSINPTIMVQGGKPVIVAGAAGGSTIIMGPTLAILDTVDFGMTLPQAVDAQRFDDQGSNKLIIEDARFTPEVLARLKAVGYTLDARGEYAVTPRMQLAGMAPADRVSTAVSDSRSDRGSLAVPVAPPPR
ncbi:MAG TPA: gamma-glutamyltransferase [Baekduia sp.]|uniref:gamma-glutamyltransferase n=1 Tax=Baekduia sp. TaxID=2600305 RepID=UPI002B9B1C25|nr:gamma-glutamyltransferase [Baekduia sp.]HMJ36786.1 gamma-glutamyltransferase [Baekduia sp.]